MKDACINKCLITAETFSLNSSVSFAKVLVMKEKWKNSVDKGKTFGALLTDLSKAFDCLPHDLIIAKLNAYGFSLSASKLTHNYLSHRKQRTKIN